MEVKFKYLGSFKLKKKKIITLWSNVKHQPFGAQSKAAVQVFKPDHIDSAGSLRLDFPSMTPVYPQSPLSTFGSLEKQLRCSPVQSRVPGYFTTGVKIIPVFNWASWVALGFAEIVCFLDLASLSWVCPWPHFDGDSIPNWALCLSSSLLILWLRPEKAISGTLPRYVHYSSSTCFWYQNGMSVILDCVDLHSLVNIPLNSSCNGGTEVINMRWQF